MPADQFPQVPSFGPSPNRIALVGEAPGAEESQQLRPFVGPTGRELRRMLRTIGLGMDDLWRTNVFDRQPSSDNNLAVGYGVEKADPLAEVALGPMTANPTSYLDRTHRGHLERLWGELEACQPNVIVALGNTACWALGLGQGIGTLRGAVHLWQAPRGRRIKVLPTFHPSAVVREWPLRTIAITDLEKAHNESNSPDLHFDNTELWLAPTLDDLAVFGGLYMAQATECALDVETKQGQITCISLAPTPTHAMVVPFWREGVDPHYWPTSAEEALAWRWVQAWVEDERIVKVTQNGLYDTMYLHAMGMIPRNFSEDTMLEHHSLFGEMRKGLGFLGSVYANVPHWKSMRTYKKEEQLKRDD